MSVYLIGYTLMQELKRRKEEAELLSWMKLLKSKGRQNKSLRREALLRRSQATQT